jgi:hypothetical protein
MKILEKFNFLEDALKPLNSRLKPFDRDSATKFSSLNIASHLQRAF